MPQNNHLQNLISLNLAILFISTSGVLGKYIDMPVPVIIGFRALFACVLLFLFCKWKKLDLKILSKDRWAVFWGGLFMGLHWVMYFYSLKLSNVAIGMLSIFTYPVITTFLEPLILKTKFQKVHLLLGILVLVGISLLVPDFDLKNDAKPNPPTKSPSLQWLRVDALSVAHNYCMHGTFPFSHGQFGHCGAMAGNHSSRSSYYSHWPHHVSVQL